MPSVGTAAPATPPSGIDVSDADAAPSKNRILIIPDSGEERGTWCKALREALMPDPTLEVCIFDASTVLQTFDDRKTAEEVAAVLGASPETTVVVGRTEGADAALYLLENRQLGGAVLYDLKCRKNLLWSAIKRNAGPKGHNLAMVCGPPPHGARFPDRYMKKLGLVTYLPLTDIERATRAAVHGIRQPKPARVRVLAFTAGLSSDAFRKWKLPEHVELVTIDADRHMERPPLDGLIGIGKALATELVAGKPCRMRRMRTTTVMRSGRCLPPHHLGGRHLGRRHLGRASSGCLPVHHQRPSS